MIGGSFDFSLLYRGRVQAGKRIGIAIGIAYGVVYYRHVCLKEDGNLTGRQSGIVHKISEVNNANARPLAPRTARWGTEEDRARACGGF